MITKPPGIEDIFPDKIEKWNHVLQTAKNIFALYNFKEIIIPILEFTEVFSRGLGTSTDIVSKEMFSFQDRGQRDLTLRPEGTASVVRAFVENGEYNRLALNKFFYYGPMFRAEKPQKGRLRQFNQFGAEVFGSLDPFYDFEIISLINFISQKIKIPTYTILLNSIGCLKCRPEFIKNLSSYYKQHQQELCPDCQKRLESNPLRLLDCKNKSCQNLKKDAPKINRFICKECQVHYQTVKKYLSEQKISYKEDPCLVRGLDYYTKTTFEFITDQLGGQNAFAAGGRYDNLVEQFQGQPTPAVGFAAGLERILLLIDDQHIPQTSLDVFIIHNGDKSLEIALKILDLLRKNNFKVDLDPSHNNFKPQFKKADREKSKFALIIGEEEIKTKTFSLKNLQSGQQESVETDKIIDYLKKKEI